MPLVMPPMETTRPICADNIFSLSDIESYNSKWSVDNQSSQQRILPEIYLITEAQRMDDQFITAHEHGRIKDDENCERPNRIPGSAVQEHEVNSLFWQTCKVSYP